MTALREIQLLLPGPAHVYDVGLPGGQDDAQLWRSTGVGREVNRHHYDAAERREALTTTVARAQRALVRIATEHPAMEGTFRWSITGSEITLTWDTDNQDPLVLEVAFTGGSARAQLRLGSRIADGAEQIAALLEESLG